MLKKFWPKMVVGCVLSFDISIHPHQTVYKKGLTKCYTDKFYCPQLFSLLPLQFFLSLIFLILRYFGWYSDPGHLEVIAQQMLYDLQHWRSSRGQNNRKKSSNMFRRGARSVNGVLKYSLSLFPFVIFHIFLWSSPWIGKELS